MKKKRRMWMWWTFAAFMGVGIAMFAGLYNSKAGQGLRIALPMAIKAFQVNRDPDRYLFYGRPRVNIVFIGRDEDRDNKNRVLNTYGRSDTLMVASFIQGEKLVHLLWIPRDTIAEIPGHSVMKVNAAHSLGGPSLVVDTLRESFGIHVDYYVELKYDGFKKAIDAVGGVDVDVPKDMKYDDDWGHLHINLKKGFQHLTGEQAHGFVRFRHDKLGDIGRIERQKMLLQALAKKMLSLQMISTLPETVETVRDCVLTNMSEDQLIALAFFMKGLKHEDIQGQSLPGRPQGGNWVADRSASIEVLALMFGNTFEPSLWSSRIASAPATKSRTRRSSNRSRATRGEETLTSDSEPEVEEPPVEELPPPASPETNPDAPAKSPESSNENPGGTPDPGKAPGASNTQNRTSLDERRTSS